MLAKTVLRQHAHQQGDALWSRLLASLAIETQDWHTAYQHLHWLVRHYPNELPLQVNLATVLPHIGKVDEATRLKHHLLTVLPQDNTAYLELVSEWAAAPRVLAQLRQERSMTSLAPQLPTLTQSQWWLKRHAALAMQPWQRLQLAMATADAQTTASLVKSNQLIPQDKINAIAALKQPYQAMKQWYRDEHVLSDPSKTDIARSLRPYYFRALELKITPKRRLTARKVS
ncbi:hypothetical protein P4S72_18320 [Vibrio sp. PP-XX7]